MDESLSEDKFSVNLSDDDASDQAFEMQINGEGFGIVEILSTCPTNWGMTPVDSLKWLEENMIPYYPLGNIRTPEGGDK